jgi:hypothetical protein
MSVDISLYATTGINEEDYVTFNDISRAFCTLIRTLDESNNELKQVAAIANVDISVIERMNTWPLWELQYGGFSTKEKEEIFIEKYNNACDASWQDIDAALSCLINLHSSLEKNILFESQIAYRLEWLSTYEYFKNFGKDILFNERRTDKNFGYDLRNMIIFLKEMQASGMRLVRLQIK